MALSVMAVSTSVSPFLMDEEDTDMFMTSAPSRLPASSNEDWVRVEASKKRFTCVRPRRTVRFLSTWRLSSTYSSDRSRRPVMSAAERPSMPSKCRWPRTKVDFDVIKARAIGGDGWWGKGQCRGSELSPDLSDSWSSRGDVNHEQYDWQTASAIACRCPTEIVVVKQDGVAFRPRLSTRF